MGLAVTIHKPKFLSGAAVPHGAKPPPAVSRELFDLASADAEEACRRLGVSAEGLSPAEADRRLRSYGPNQITRERQAPLLLELWKRFRNPLNAMLLVLAAVS